MTTDEIVLEREIDYKKEKLAIIKLAKKRLQYIVKRKKVSQSQLGQILQGRLQSTISKQLSLKSTVMPSFADITLLCKLMNVDIRYLIYPDIDYEEAAFTHYEKMKKIPIEFVETSIHKQIYQICTDVLKNQNIMMISTVAKNGTTTSLKKFVQDNFASAIYFNNFSAINLMNEKIRIWFDIESDEDFEPPKKIVIVFDDVELIKPLELKNIIEYYYVQYKIPLIFLGKEIGKELMELLPENSIFHNLESLLVSDIKQILLANIPTFPMDKFHLAENITGGNIYNLISMIKFIKEEDSNTFSYDKLYEKRFT